MQMKGRMEAGRHNSHWWPLSEKSPLEKRPVRKRNDAPVAHLTNEPIRLQGQEAHDADADAGRSEESLILFSKKLIAIWFLNRREDWCINLI